MLSRPVRHQIQRGQKVKQCMGHLFRHLSSSSARRQNDSSALNKEYDAIIVGAGHNGLVASAYLQKAGLNTLVLERRHLIGGAAVTEEIVPGYKFSRCSYVLSLLRPIIVKDLELKKHGLKVHLRSDHAFTPLLEEPGPNGRPRSLLMSKDEEFTKQQIAQFSKKDAEAYHEFDEYLMRIAGAIGPLLDNPPLDLKPGSRSSLKQKMQMVDIVKSMAKSGKALGQDIPEFYKLLTAPMNKILDSWFESEPLKATLATDSVIGAFLTPDTPGSGYVLLHHVMGEIEGVKGAWGYAEGGMGAVSGCIASSARSHGATILTEKPVSSVLVSGDNQACGVVLEDGTEIKSKMVLSNATPKITFLDLIPSGILPEEFVQEVSSFDFKSPVTKINVAVNRLPNFTAMPNKSDNTPGPNHFGTIHLNCERTDLLNKAYDSAMLGEIPELPMIEMCIPSSLDPTLAPEGCHVISLFTQYTPYELSGGRQWDEETKDMYCDRVFDCIEAYAPGFKDSVVGRDILTPPDLERIFGLTGGNIFHGAMSLDQLYFSRPFPSCGSYRTPIKGLYLCGSGSHPGGGVMGAPGRNAAMVVKADML
ncbi:pyridine nucleotide-disulfide oxidoreductase domain-containing protein 2 [Strongylocentrotus purpuratus]|uniref:Pyridine nucleotide-disulfide oxidoreductase domain-containing protein 2 n=1 Tax=Strongylocentrotus purpuratus TaxID=7668 RepID=A0A7M7SYX4_STRPU|nr:pyridine nucleotide-disulfide oxidoreductase domain-containing protein 2 [Strongylocentrotus purpuratus]XP_030841598.1 pyridine nucleotide-disulfide oxidoreductase domain-containing protein 2 [Strongylocentrotus purpuratus]